MMSLWAWVRRMLGLQVFDRMAALERRAAHNRAATNGAIDDAFKQFAKDARR